MLSELQWKRLSDKIEFGDCWVIPSAQPRPVLWVNGFGRPMNAHRAVWYSLVGPIPDLDLHHMCGNTRCVNPDHMQPMTRGENRKLERRYRCMNGHPQNETNTRRSPDGDRVWCRVCDKLRKRVSREHGQGRN